jgi:hypothetical protein
MSDLIGRTLRHCRIVEKIGEGGMTRIMVGFESFDTASLATVAVAPHIGVNEGKEKCSVGDGARWWPWELC